MSSDNSLISGHILGGPSYRREKRKFDGDDGQNSGGKRNTADETPVGLWYQSAPGGSGRHGGDVPSALAVFNRALAECVIMFTSSTQVEDAKLPAPLVITKHGDCRIIQNSQDPGIQFMITDPAEQKKERDNVHDQRKTWHYTFRRKAINLPVGKRVARQKISWMESASAPAADGKEHDVGPAHKSPARQMIDDFAKENQIHGSNLGDPSFDKALDKIAACCDQDGQQKSIYLVTFQYKREYTPYGIPDYAAKNGPPDFIQYVNDRLREFNQVTIAYRHARHAEEVYNGFDTHCKFWDLVGSAYWHGMCKLVNSETGQVWAPKTGDELRLTPECGLGSMFESYMGGSGIPVHQEWMIKAPLNSKDKFIMPNPNENIEYASHPSRQSYDGMDQVEHELMMGLIFDLEHTSRQWYKDCNDQIEHEMDVYLKSPVRAEFTFNKKHAVALPKFSVGQRFIVKCKGITGSHDLSGSAPKWTGTVTEAYPTTTGNFVAFLSTENSFTYGEFTPGNDRGCKVTLSAIMNTAAHDRHMDAVRTVVKTKNETVKKLILNHGFDATHIAKHLIQHTEDLNSEEVTEEWVNVKPIHEEDLTNVQEQARKAFYGAYNLNNKQKLFRDKILYTRSGFVGLQGRPSTGKSYAITAAAFEINLRGKSTVVAATTNYAKDKMGDKLLRMWSFLPDNIRKDRLLLFVPQLSTLQNTWRETSLTSEEDSIAYTNDLLGLLNKRLEPVNDMNQKEYHEMGSQILRMSARLLEIGNAPVKELMQRWTAVYTKYIQYQSVSEKERTGFNNILGTLCRLIFEKTALAVGTCAALATPMFRDNMQYFDAILHDEASYSTKPDTFILLNINHGLYVSVGDPQQQPPKVMSQNVNEYAASLEMSLFECHLNVGMPIDTLSIQYGVLPDTLDFRQR